MLTGFFEGEALAARELRLIEDMSAFRPLPPLGVP